jgi:hypothetical protein
MQLPDSPTPPPALDPTVTYRENHIVADCRTEGGQRKVGQVQGFTIACDESPQVGGEGTAPSPLGYFTAAIGF